MPLTTPWTIPTFTLARFSALTLAAVAVALAAHIPLATQTRPLTALLRPADAVGQDNGTLTSNFYLATTYTPVPLPHTPEPLTPPTPQPIKPVLRPYPPLAR